MELLKHNPTRARLKSVDALRGAAALAVLLFHAINYGNNYHEAGNLPIHSIWFRVVYGVLNHADLGVPLFFVLSGFCIHLRWVQQVAATGNQGINFVDFWKRRMRRLYPPYVVALCLSMTLILAAFLAGKSTSNTAEYPGSPLRWMGIDFTAHLLMLHGFHNILWKKGGNAVFWTLAVEEYFYLLYFILLAWRRRFGLSVSLLSVLLVGTVVSIVGGSIFPNNSRSYLLINSSALVLWIQWCLGMAAAEAYYRMTRLPRWTAQLWLVPVWGAAALAVEHYAAGFTAHVGTLVPLLWGMVFFTLMNGCIQLEQNGLWPTAGLAGRFVRWLGGVGLCSYSLYLVHLPVRSSLRTLFHLDTRVVGPVVYCGVAFMLAVAGYVAGRAFFFLVERHFLHVRPSRLRTGDTAVGSTHPSAPAKLVHAVSTTSFFGAGLSSARNDATQDPDLEPRPG